MVHRIDMLTRFCQDCGISEQAFLEIGKMSYDIDIGKNEFNYTYNLAYFFHNFIHRDDPSDATNLKPITGLQALDGLTGREALDILKGAFDAISVYCHEKSFTETYDAPNGWGSTLGATVFLAKLMGACATNRKKVVRVS